MICAGDFRDTAVAAAAPTPSGVPTVVGAFAFVDLCRLVRYSDAAGSAPASEVLALLRSRLRREAQRHGVRVIKWLGGGAMLSGGETEAVISCTLGVRDAIARATPLALRGGIATGVAMVLDGDDYVGGATKAAARLCARARDNQVLATIDAAEHVPDLVTVRPVPALRVPELDSPTEIRELLGPGRLGVSPDVRRGGRKSQIDYDVAHLFPTRRQHGDQSPRG